MKRKNSKIIGIIICTFFITSATSLTVNALNHQLIVLNNPPETPHDPTPKDGETDLKLKTDLHWSCLDWVDGRRVYFEVYFGTQVDPPCINYCWQAHEKDGQCSPVQWYDLDPLEPNTRYYWRIVAKFNEEEKYEGTVWTFKTGAPKPWLDTGSSLDWYKFYWERFPTQILTKPKEFYIKIRNCGDPGSIMKWSIFYNDYKFSEENQPAWAEFSFEPKSGSLSPDDGWLTIKITIIESNYMKKGTSEREDFFIYNNDDIESDNKLHITFKCSATKSNSDSDSKPLNHNIFSLFERLLLKFPILNKLIIKS